MIATITRRVGSSVVSIERFRALPIMLAARAARCGECSVDPRHPSARVCAVANCPIRHVVPRHHSQGNAA